MPMKHYHKDERVQSLMIEINRWLYLGDDYSVDSERTETLVSMLGRVAEVLEKNQFCYVKNHIETENQG